MSPRDSRSTLHAVRTPVSHALVARLTAEARSSSSWRDARRSPWTPNLLGNRLRPRLRALLLHSVTADDSPPISKVPRGLQAFGPQLSVVRAARAVYRVLRAISEDCSSRIVEK